MSDGSSVLVAMIDVDPADAEEFNRWYTMHHIPERLKCPGFLSARFLNISEGDLPKYLVIFELAGLEALRSAEYLALGTQEDTKRWATRFTRLMRGVYSQ